MLTVYSIDNDKFYTKVCTKSRTYSYYIEESTKYLT